MSKLVNSVGDLDRIGSLPDSILSHILSFLPTKDAVRTSILSSRWRYFFTSMSNLDFDSCLSDLSSENMENFMNFFDRLLFLSNHLALERFRLGGKLSWDGNHFRLRGWIYATLWRGIKELDISSGKLSVLPIDLFTCKTLVTLKLDMETGDIKVPTNVCFPNLKTLHLKNIGFADGASIDRLISGCLPLEDLVMELPYSPLYTSKFIIHKLSLKSLVLTNYDEIHEDEEPRDYNYEVEINAPNLVYFHYADLFAESYTVSNMKFLEKAYFEIHPFDMVATNGMARERTAIQFLQAIGNVQSLSLVIDLADTIYGTNLEPLLAFNNLVELRFENCGPWNGKWIVEFLHSTPNLKKLILDLGDPTSIAPGDGLRSVPNKVPSCFSSYLKEIEILDAAEERQMFEIIRYFLKHGIVLESLSVAVDKRRLRKEILRLPRNSRCQIYF